MNKFTVVNHPLIQRDITTIREKNTPPEHFRAAVRRISTILAVEISREFTTVPVSVSTPLEVTTGAALKEKVILIPVLRAGLGMVAGFLDVIPDAHVGHIGMQRDEKTLEPREYYFKVPADLDSAQVILLDPMLATGGSAVGSIEYLMRKGAKNCSFACVVAAPEGVARFSAACPSVPVFAAVLDRQLNNVGYILPGLGDAGDRTFGTF